eukprot:TRINITY_DN17857_c0_g1_i2.p1 TRINITY_DN17857_c0_g1~~TRINITY_DN17857_c0_g1_i2.p1  ORF type:complete len:166 (+),score=29.91 TRINITY_DN17857_c0_g1_i2:98-595(+)
MLQLVAIMYIRIVCSLLFFMCMMQFFGDALNNGWDKALGTLDKKAAAVARVGVLWDHFFQGVMCLMALIVNEVGDTNTRRGILVVLSIAFLPLAPLLMYFMQDDTVGYESGRRNTEMFASGLIGLAAWGALFASLTDGLKERLLSQKRMDSTRGAAKGRATMTCC